MLPMTRRDALKLGLVSSALVQLPISTARAGAAAASAQQGSAQFVDLPKDLYAGPGLPGGGQLDIRMSFDYSGIGADEDVLEVQRRMKPFNPESWHVEWFRVAEKNEELAVGYKTEGRTATAHLFYRRASGFYTRALTYLPETDDRVVKTTKKMQSTFDEAWTLKKPPFQRFSFPWEGKSLDGYFFPVPNGGARAPVVYGFQGADSMNAFGAADGGYGAYWERGMSFCAIDEPGRGTTKRLKQIYMPPDWERYAKAVVDYLVSRSDVNANRIGVYGSSMGGYTTPRAVAFEKRCAAAAMWSGAYSLIDDLYDFYPPIQDRMRWIIGAPNLTEARKRLAEYTMAGKASQIECPMLIGYQHDDRIMSPYGARKLYNEATRSKRELKDGIGHGGSATERQIFVLDWMAKHLVDAKS